MSLFLITNQIDKADKAKQRWIDIFGRAETFDLQDGFYLTLTNAYRKRKHFYKEYNNSLVFGFGTFFTKRGFGCSAFTSSINLSEFDSDVASNIFGHYIFVIKNDEKIRVITDRVGVLNVFYASNLDGVFVSNDLTMISGVSNNVALSESGVQQFVLNESCIGSCTIYKNIKRLKSRYELVIDSTFIKESLLYDTKVDVLSFDEYIARIEYYFSMIAKYNGRVAVDLSAGYDTRLIASCAYKKISKLMAITNQNKFDNGIDESTAPIVANKLKLSLHVINNKKYGKKIYDDLVNGFYTGRDIFRSVAWLPRLKDKYFKTDLVLGGYGGEALRGKYIKYKNHDLFVRYFYHGNNISKFSYISNNYINTAVSELHAYDYQVSNEGFGNMIYIMDRMRIWGGHSITVTSLYGDILHPFMDWYLIGPVFNWDINELKGAYLQKKIMEYFSKDISKIPFNAASKKELNYRMKNKNYLILIIVRIIYRAKAIANKIIIKLFSRYRNKNKIRGIYEFFQKEKLSDEFQRKSNINLSALEQYGAPNNISRLATVQYEIDFTLEFSKNK